MIGNIIKIQDDLKSLPEKELINEAQNPSGLAPIYLVLGELQRREKVKAEFAGQQQPTQTIAEQHIEGATPPAPPMPMGGSPVPPGPEQAIPPANQVMPSPVANANPAMLASTGVGALPAPNVGQYAEGGVVGFADGGFFGQGIKGAERRGVIEAVRPESQTAENYSTQARPQGLGGLAFMIKNKEGSPYKGFFKDAFGSHKYDRSEQSRLMKLIGKLGLFDQMEDQYMSKHGFDYPEYAQGGIVGFQNRGAVNYPGGNRLTYPYEAAPEVTDEELQNLIKAREANYPARQPGTMTYDFARDDYGTIDGSPQGPANDPYTGALSTNVVPYQSRAADAANVDMMDSFNEKIGRWVDDEPTTRINPMTGKEETYYGVNIDPLKEAAGDIWNKIKMTEEEKREQQRAMGIDPDAEGPIKINEALGQWSDEEGKFTADPIWEAVENIKNLWRGRGKDEDVTEEVTEEVTDVKELPEIEVVGETPQGKKGAPKEEVPDYTKPLANELAALNNKEVKDYFKEATDLIADSGIYKNKTDKRQAEIDMRITAEQDRQMNFAMMKAGAAMMAGESEFALTNVGKGLEIGIAAYEKSEDKIAELQDKKMEIEEKADTIDRERKLAALNFGMRQYQADQTNAATYMTNLYKIRSDANLAQFNRQTKLAVARIGKAPDSGDWLKATQHLDDMNWSDNYDLEKGATENQLTGTNAEAKAYRRDKQEAKNREMERLLNLPAGTYSPRAEYNTAGMSVLPEGA